MTQDYTEPAKEKKGKLKKEKKEKKGKKKGGKGVAIVVLIFLAAPVIWNHVPGQPTLKYATERYCARGTGKLAGHISGQGVLTLKQLISKRARPAWNPITIGWQQAWYNMITSGYDQHLWIQPCEPSAGSAAEYGLYFSNRTMFLRRVFHGYNQVLHTEFSSEQLENILLPYMKSEK